MFRIRPVAFALALTAGAATVAAAQTTEQSTRTEQAAKPRPHRGHRAERRLFKGITLTSAQKAQVRAIHKKFAEQNKPLFQSMKPAMQEARAARQKGDTAAARAAWQKTAAQREQLRALRQNEVSEVRAVLTADQQKQFDQNVAAVKARMQQRGQRAAQHGRNG